MKINRTRFAAIAVVSTAAMALGGCLAGEDSGTAFSADSTSGGNSTQNRAPVISGNPPSAVTIGGSYSFTPTASDPDGDVLTFSVQNMPDWASFDSSTGTLSGTPSLANTGAYQNIVIGVSDGSLSSNLSPFPVEVVQAALGSATRSWTPPVQNGDGTTLNDLAAYKFYFGTEPGQYTNSVRIDNPGMATYVIENLVPDTYYFVATAVNSRGVESRYSNEAVQQVL